MYPRQDCMLVAVRDPRVRRRAVVQGANKCICDRVKVGRDSRPNVKTHFHTVTCAFIRAENDCPSPETWVWNCDKQSSRMLWASSLLVSCILLTYVTLHWGHRVNKHSTGCPTSTEEQCNSFSPNVMAKNCLDGYTYTVTNSKHGAVTWCCVRRDLAVQCPATLTTSAMQPALLHPFPKCKPKCPLFTQLQAELSEAETPGPKCPNRSVRTETYAGQNVRDSFVATDKN